MATKTSSVYVRLEPGVKESAEKVLTAIGLPLSSAVNIFLKQVAMRRCIPFSLALPKEHRIEMGQMSAEKINDALDEGYQAYLRKEGQPADNVFQAMEKDLGI